MELSALMALATIAAVDHTVPVDVFHNLIGAESNWQVDAVSPSGCWGLGQINPRFYELRDWRDPAENLDKAAEVLAWNIAYRVKAHPNMDALGQLALAVASYNMGYMAVNRLLERHGGAWWCALDSSRQRYISRVLGLGRIGGVE